MNMRNKYKIHILKTKAVYGILKSLSLLFGRFLFYNLLSGK